MTGLLLSRGAGARSWPTQETTTSSLWQPQCYLLLARRELARPAGTPRSRPRKPQPSGSGPTVSGSRLGSPPLPPRAAVRDRPVLASSLLAIGSKEKSACTSSEPAPASGYDRKRGPARRHRPHRVGVSWQSRIRIAAPLWKRHCRGDLPAGVSQSCRMPSNGASVTHPELPQ